MWARGHARYFLFSWLSPANAAKTFSFVDMDIASLLLFIDALF
jgi:hypothetical protein